MTLSVATRSGALSTSVPSRSKTTVGATIVHDRYRLPGPMASRRRPPPLRPRGWTWEGLGRRAGKGDLISRRTALDRRAVTPRFAGGALLVAMDVEAQKRAAAAAALEFVRPGMRLGLGSGSTAKHFVELLAERVRAGLDVIGVPTSEATRADAERLGVPRTSLDEMPELDLTIDGADEIAADLSLIKGGGGALLREKMVASASARMVVIADESKWVSALGRFPLPIEVVPFGLAATRRNIDAATGSAGCSGAAMLRRGRDGHAFVTDGGHWILDAALERIADPGSLADRLDRIAGVVEHGLFIGLAHAAVVAGASGVRVIERR